LRKAKTANVGLLKKVRLLRRCAPRNDRRFIFMSLRAIQRIARQSQLPLWDFFNSPNVTPAKAGVQSEKAGFLLAQE